GSGPLRVLHPFPTRRSSDLAVADYRPARAAIQKMKRGAAALKLELLPNPDILAGLTKRRRAGQTFVGFALETARGVANARAKLRDRKSTRLNSSHDQISYAV